jgi:YbgC/YbaW family acyl-CoA thioester hydrolase
MQTYQFKVLESHLDTFAHMNNATYLKVFEEARWDWITRAGLSLQAIQREQVGPVLLEAHLVFKRELKLREDVRIETRFLAMKNPLVMMIEQKMIKVESNELAARLEVHVGVFDMKTRKLMSPPPKWQEAIELIKA